MDIASTAQSRMGKVIHVLVRFTRMTISIVALSLVGSLGLMIPARASAGENLAFCEVGSALNADDMSGLSVEENQLVSDSVSPEILDEISIALSSSEASTEVPSVEGASGAAIPAVVLAAAAWCGKGALSGIGGQVLTDVLKGSKSARADYVRSIIAGCMLGEFGLAWKLLSPTLKAKAINAVVSLIIRMS